MLPYHNAMTAYLQHITRTRPWTVAHEADTLAAFGTWLQADARAPHDLAALTPGVVARYATATRQTAAAHAVCESTLRRLCAWAEYTGLIAHNGFVGATPHALRQRV